MTTSLVLAGCAALLVNAGCGGPAPRADDGAPSAATPESEPVAPIAVVEDPAPVPAEQPPVPPLPERLGPGATRQQVQAAALELVDDEADRDELGDIEPTERAHHVTEVWWQAVQTARRGQPSQVPGLTVGEVAQQPPAPPLPALVDLDTTTADLARHAYLVALDERASGMLVDLDPALRQRYLVWAWTPLLEQEQARRRAALAEREARQAHLMREVVRHTRWQADIDAVERETARLVEIEQRKTIPVLSPEERAELDALRD